MKWHAMAWRDDVQNFAISIDLEPGDLAIKILLGGIFMRVDV